MQASFQSHGLLDLRHQAPPHWGTLSVLDLVDALSSSGRSHSAESFWTHSDLRTRKRFGSVAISAGRNGSRRNTGRCINARSARRSFGATKRLQHRLRARTVPVSIPGRHQEKRVLRAGASLFSPALPRAQEPGERCRPERGISVGALDLARGVRSRVAATDETRSLPSRASRFFRRDDANPEGFGLTRALPEGMNRAGCIFLYSMLTIGSFAIAAFAVLGCVFWACLNDRDRT